MAAGRWKARWDASRAAVATVQLFCEEQVAPALKSIHVNDSDRKTNLGCMYGAFLRARAWLRTLVVLKGPVHIQAILAGARALMEVYLDVALLEEDHTSSAAEQISTWEDAKMLDMRSVALEQFTSPGGIIYGKKGLDLSEWTNVNEAKIRRDMYALGWTGKPPNRWTGNGIPKDVDEVDRITADRKEGPCTNSQPLGAFPIKACYRLGYKIQCIATHGSALALLDTPSSSKIAALAVDGLVLSCDLAAHICKIILRSASRQQVLDKLAGAVKEVRSTVTAHDIDLLSFHYTDP